MQYRVRHLKGFSVDLFLVQNVKSFMKLACASYNIGSFCNFGTIVPMFYTISSHCLRKDKQCNFLKSNEGECFILNVSLGTWGVIILSTSSLEISQHFILHHSLEDGSIWKFTTYILRDLLKRPQKSFARV